jgi:hypothetical protein
VAMASAVSLAEAGHGFGGGGFGGHGFGGGGFGGHAFSNGGFGGHSFGGSARGFAVGPRAGFAFSGPHVGRGFVGPRGTAFVGPRGGVYANRHYGGRYYAHNDHHGDHDHHFHHGHRVFVGYGFYYGYYDGDYYDYGYGGGCGWLYRRAVVTGSPYWWNRYNACLGYD